VQKCIKRSTQQGVFQLLNLFSGGALLQLSLFALGIMPYITASIIIQLLTVVIPRFEQLKKEGRRAGQADPVHPLPHDRLAHPAGHRHRGDGRPGQLFGTATTRHRRPDHDHPAQQRLDLASSSSHDRRHRRDHVAGELITERGVGNGMSLLMFVNIAARIPFEGANILTRRTAA
jgi:preprotein translocase subunit SecY